MIIAETFAARLLERELRAPQRRPTTELLVVCKSWKELVEPILYREVHIHDNEIFSWLANPGNVFKSSNIRRLYFLIDPHRIQEWAYDCAMTSMLPHLKQLVVCRVSGYLARPEHYKLLPISTRTTLRQLYLHIRPALHPELSFLNEFKNLKSLALDHGPCSGVDPKLFDYSSFEHSWNLELVELAEFTFTWSRDHRVPAGCRHFLASCRFSMRCSLKLDVYTMRSSEVSDLNPLFDSHPFSKLEIDCQGASSRSSILDHRMEYFGSNTCILPAELFRRAIRLPPLIRLRAMFDPRKVSWAILDVLIEIRTLSTEHTPITIWVSPDAESIQSWEYEFRWGTVPFDAEQIDWHVLMIRYARRLLPLGVTIVDMDGLDVSSLTPKLPDSMFGFPFKM